MTHQGRPTAHQTTRRARTLGLFRRGRKAEAAAEVDTPTHDTGDPADVGGDPTGDADADADSDVDLSDGADAAEAPPEPDADVVAFSRARGPFDSSEVDEDANRLDLGSIQIVPVDGMQLRLELDETQTTVVGVHALLGESGVQLQAFAAPRTFGLWEEIRDEIAQSIVTQGGTADDVAGPLGRELQTRMPSRAADGRTVFQPVRFLGVDGPRWFLRAVLSGPAAVHEAVARPLIELVRHVVVVRGEEARPPREGLPLTLPEQLQPEDADAAADAAPAGAADEAPAGAAGGDDDALPRRIEDLRPFERGPEITEIR